MKTNIIISKSATKDYEKISEPYKSKVKNTIDLLKETGFDFIDIKSLKGEFKGLYRIKAGDYRIIFRKDKDEFKIVSILHRKDIYKKK